LFKGLSLNIGVISALAENGLGTDHLHVLLAIFEVVTHGLFKHAQMPFRRGFGLVRVTVEIVRLVDIVV
jgi:hypothetical protein